MNKIILFGNLTKDPELSETPSGKSVCKFSIATNEKYGETEETNFFNITAFGSQGEAIHKYIKKGRKILLEGRVKVSDFEKDGVKRRSWDVILNKFEFVPSGDKADTSGDEGYRPEPVPEERSQPAVASKPADDDLPF